MKLKTKSLYLVPLLALSGLAASSCSNEMEEIMLKGEGPTLGKTNYIELTISDFIDADGSTPDPGTRAILNSEDHWTSSVYSVGDKVGLFAVQGGQNPEDPEDFSMPIQNLELEYAGGSGKIYRFAIVDGSTIDTEKVYGTNFNNYYVVYYPYYKDMPNSLDPSTVPGMPVRVKDPKDGIYKMVDYMYSHTYSSNSITYPDFMYIGAMLMLQRGEGFTKAKDKRIWVVMREPYTDIRITQSSATSSYTKSGISVYKNNLSETGDDLLMELPTKNKVNKNKVFEAWEGSNYKNAPTYYCYIPPTYVSYVVIQDDNGNWQNVTDFYLANTYNKLASAHYRYRLIIEQKGLNVTARPITTEEWGDETNITDERKMGIGSVEEYNEWVRTYNAYIGDNRNPAYEETLKKFGEGLKTPDGSRTNWTFYMNGDISFTASTEFYQINKLEDKFIRTADYANFKISNIKTPLVKEIAEGGLIKGIDFDGIYLVQASSSSAVYYGAIAESMTGGAIEQCKLTNGILIGNKAVGMIAGSVLNGSVTDCFISGDVIGLSSSTVNGVTGLFGVLVAGGDPVVLNNNTSGLQFIKM